MLFNFVFISGRCFAELQITGVECEYTKRPYDLSVSFILSSLLLVDAMQTFGSDYELLVSSKMPSVSQGNCHSFFIVPKHKNFLDNRSHSKIMSN